MKKLLFIFDAKKIILGEIIDFFKSFKLKNSQIEKLFKLDKSKKKKNFLIVSLTNSNFTLNTEALFGKYFNLSGYNVCFLTNFSQKRAWQTFRSINAGILFHNFLYYKNALKLFFKLKKFPEARSGEELKNFTWEGIALGIGVYSTVSRKLKAGQLDFSKKEHRQTARKFLWRSLVYFETAKEIFKRIKPDLVVSLEKGYVGHSEVFRLAIDKGIDFIQWVGCHEPNAIVFKRYNKNNLKDPPISVSKSVWQEFSNKPWQEKYREEVSDVFKKGYLKGDWFKYNQLLESVNILDKKKFIKKYDLDPAKKIIVLFSHILWDANIFYGDDLFEKGFGEWLVESAKIMQENKDVNWLIKVHPANRFKHRLENIKGEYSDIRAIKDYFGKIPENIKIIYPEDNLNPYCLFNIIDCAITVRGTVGMEYPCFGVPSITAGTGSYSGKGFTRDSNSKEEYLEKLKQIENVHPLAEEEIQKALRYAYLVFKSRPLKFSSFKEKFTGDEMDLDIIINNLELGSDFRKFVDWAINSRSEDFLN